jgi:hypothetical protein
MGIMSYVTGFTPKHSPHAEAILPAVSQGSTYTARISFEIEDCRSIQIKGMKKSYLDQNFNRLSKFNGGNITGKFSDINGKQYQTKSGKEYNATKHKDKNLKLSRENKIEIIKFFTNVGIEKTLSKNIITFIKENLKYIEKFVNIKFTFNNKDYSDHLVAMCAKGMDQTKVAYVEDTQKSYTTNQVAFFDSNHLTFFPSEDVKNTILLILAQSLGLYDTEITSVDDMSVLAPQNFQDNLRLCKSKVKTKYNEQKEVCELISFFDDTIKSKGINTIISSNDRVFHNGFELKDGVSIAVPRAICVLSTQEQVSIANNIGMSECVAHKFHKTDLNGLRKLYGNGPGDYEGSIDVPSSCAPLIGILEGNELEII